MLRTSNGTSGDAGRGTASNPFNGDVKPLAHPFSLHNHPINNLTNQLFAIGDRGRRRMLVGWNILSQLFNTVKLSCLLINASQGSNARIRQGDTIGE